MTLEESIAYLRTINPKLDKTKIALPIALEAAEKTLKAEQRRAQLQDALAWSNPFGAP